MQILSYTSRMFWIIISFCDRNIGYFLAFFVQCMNGNLTHLFHDWNFHSWIYGYRYWIYVWNNYDVSSAQFFASFSSDPIMIDPLSYQSSHEFIFKVLSLSFSAYYLSFSWIPQRIYIQKRIHLKIMYNPKQILVINKWPSFTI